MLLSLVWTRLFDDVLDLTEHSVKVVNRNLADSQFLDQQFLIVLQQWKVVRILDKWIICLLVSG